MMTLTKIYKFIARKYLQVSLFCFCLPVMLNAKTYFFDESQGIISYLSTSFAVNYYDYGFLKRGLVGTFLVWVPGERYGLIALVCSCLVFFAFLFIFNFLVKKLKDQKTSDFLKVVFAISPFASFQFGYELGRFDLYNLVLMVAALYCVHMKKWFFVLVLSICGLLVHEAFAAFALPLIVGFFLIQPSSSFGSKILNRFFYLTVYLMACSALAYAIIKYGNNELVAMRAPGSGHEAWERPLIQHGLKLGWFNLVIISAIFFSVYFFLINFYRMNRGKVDALFVSAFAPISLLFLGCDYSRWSALVGIVVLSVLFIKCYFFNWSFKYGSFPYQATVFLLPFGPVGVVNVFPWIQACYRVLGGYISA